MSPALDGGSPPGLKIVMLGESWPTHRAGGLNRYFEESFRAFKSLGIDVKAVVAAGDLQESDVVSCARTSDPLLRRILAFHHAAAASCTGSDLVDVHFALYAVLPLLSRCRGLPIVVHFQGPWALESRINRVDSRPRVAVKRALEFLVYRKAREIVVLSSAFRRLLVEEYSVLPWKVNVVPPATNLKQFLPGLRHEARTRLSLPQEARIALCVRRLVRRMGVDVLLRAWAELVSRNEATYHLVIVGDGEERCELESLSEELGISSSVRFAGYVEQKNLSEHYRAADVTVVPSLDLEGFGLVMLESLACGTPVIGTRTSGIPEVLSGLDPTLLVDPGDHQAISRRLREAFEGKVPSVSECRSFAESFSWEVAALRNLEVFGAAVHRPASLPRVVFVDHCAQLSGGELAMLRMVPALSGFRTHVILGEPGPLVTRLDTSGVSNEILPIAPALGRLRREELRFGAPALLGAALTATYVGRLALRLRRLKPDIVHTNSLKAAIYGGIAGKLAGIPVVIHLRDRLAPDYLPAWTVPALRWLLPRLADHVVANSESTKSQLRGSSVGVTVIPSPLLPGIKCSERPQAPDEIHVGMVGRVAPWKGQHVFLEAFKVAFPEGGATATIVGAALFGEEGYETTLKKQVSELGLDGRVSFAGFVDDVPSALAGMDILVHASIVPEPLGMAVLEGMAAGLTVIASDAGGPSEVITSGDNGILYPPGDAEALAKVLREVALAPSMRARLGEAAKKVSDRYSTESVAARLEEIYGKILAERGAVG